MWTELLDWDWTTVGKTIIGAGLDGIIAAWNPAAERVYGHSAKEALGQHVSLIWPVERLAEGEWILTTISRGEHIDHVETQHPGQPRGSEIRHLNGKRTHRQT